LVPTPNNDTLYSTGFLDVSHGPVEVDVPAFGSRYYSLAFSDAYTNVFSIIGTRNSGGDGAQLLLVPAEWKGEVRPEVTLIRAPTPQVRLIVRILVDGPEDLPAAHELQDAIAIRAPQGASSAPPVPAEANGTDFVRIVNLALAANPPPETDEVELADLKDVGIGPDAPELSWRQQLLWRLAYPFLQQKLIQMAEANAEAVDGWIYAPPNTGDFGVDYANRAVVALRRSLALPPSEAAYSVPVADAEGKPLDGDSSYRLHLRAGAPPVEGFWSLSAYEVRPDGAMDFGGGSASRHAVGDRTRGLRRNADCSLDILIQHEPPKAEFKGLWLPIPKQRFALVMRAYLPSRPIGDDVFYYPPLQRIAKAQ
jgi:hypothetical protein